MKIQSIFCILISSILVQACGNSASGPGNFSGTWTGARQMGAPGKFTDGKATVSDSTGVYVAGNTDGSLGGNPPIGKKDLFLTKYDLSGNKLWTKQLGAPNANTYVSGMAIDSSSVYIAGYTDGSFDGNTMMGTKDAVLVKFTLDGGKLWSTQLGVGACDTSGRTITLDSSGIYMSGNTSGALDGNTLTGEHDIFVTKYSYVGTKQWSRQYGASGASTNAYASAVDAGGVYIAGSTTGALGNQTLTGSIDYFFVKYSQTGNMLALRESGVVSKSSIANSIAVDASGVYVAGYTDGGMDGNVITGVNDAFIVKFNNAGNKVWTNQLGLATKSTSAKALGLDGSGVYVAGYTNGGLDGNPITGTNDGFITKYSATGVKAWTRQFGVSVVNTDISSINVDASGIYVAGKTSGGLDGNLCAGLNDVFVSKYNSSGIKQ